MAKYHMMKVLVKPKASMMPFYQGIVAKNESHCDKFGQLVNLVAHGFHHRSIHSMKIG